MREAWGTLRVASASEINGLGHPTGWQNFSDAIVRGVHPSKTAKGEAAEVVVGAKVGQSLSLSGGTEGWVGNPGKSNPNPQRV